eukprot:scaffold3847_cov43-Phaeocystis_antarctica.AAC.1
MHWIYLSIYLHWRASSAPRRALSFLLALSLVDSTPDCTRCARPLRRDACGRGACCRASMRWIVHLPARIVPACTFARVGKCQPRLPLL